MAKDHNIQTFATTPEIRAIINDLATELKLNKSEVIRLGIKTLYSQHNAAVANESGESIHAKLVVEDQGSIEALARILGVDVKLLEVGE